MITQGLPIKCMGRAAMGNQRMTWEEISKRYNQQWVELVDYDWPEGAPFPRAGVVRTHEADRKRFHSIVKRREPSGSALVFVGVPTKEEKSVPINLCRIEVCS
jgi:hypothetical protein